MRICFFAGANSAHSYRWIRYFAGAGHEVDWISLAPLAQPIEGVRFHYIGPLSGNPFRVLRQGWEFRRLLRKIGSEVLHVHSAGTYGLIAWLSGYHPLIVTAWGSDVLFSLESPLRKLLVRRILRSAEMVTCDAEHMRKVLLALGVHEEKVKRINFGVEPDFFAKGGKDMRLLRAWGAEGRRVVISLRNLEPVYDIDTLIRAVPIVKEANPDVKFVIGGGGTQELRLKSLTRTLGISDSVAFIGRYSLPDLPRYLQSSDVYVSTSLSDAGIAASTAEAMACCIPVIVSDSGENTAWITDLENGAIFPARRHDMLAEKINLFLSDPALRARCGMAGRERIVRDNNYYVEMSKMEDIYGAFAATP
ncbi:MAG: glycosyltransferase family 4 protein [Elusimicrobiales bacterium]|nr:glycosyltransferase family 4 protein [Elusimicrobiales bacterium]